MLYSTITFSITFLLFFWEHTEILRTSSSYRALFGILNVLLFLCAFRTRCLTGVWVARPRAAAGPTSTTASEAGERPRTWWRTSRRSSSRGRARWCSSRWSWARLRGCVITWARNWAGWPRRWRGTRTSWRSWRRWRRGTWRRPRSTRHSSRYDSNLIFCVVYFESIFLSIFSFGQCLKSATSLL